MDIIKNDKTTIVSGIDAELLESNRAGFNCTLKVKHNPLTSDAACKKINDLIASHFDLLCDAVKTDDVYKIVRGSVDSDAESGNETESVIDYIEHWKNETENNQVYVFFTVELSKTKSFTF
jgi:hypothetical protein